MVIFHLLSYDFHLVFTSYCSIQLFPWCIAVYFNKGNEDNGKAGGRWRFVNAGHLCINCTSTRLVNCFSTSVAKYIIRDVNSIICTFFIV